jgi:hypothetical protein
VKVLYISAEHFGINALACLQRYQLTKDFRDLIFKGQRDEYSNSVSYNVFDLSLRSLSLGQAYF